jgi:hypothetical protein
MAVGLTGCGLIHGPEQQPDKGGSISNESRSNGSSPAKKVYVTYHGPERLTHRFGKFFEIAADDFHITIAGKARDADAQMEVTITEEDTHEKLKARILHAGLILRGGNQATIHYCEHVYLNDPDPALEFLDYSLIFAKGLVAALKKSQPTVVRTFVDPLKSNVDPHFAEIVRRELVKADYVPVTNAADADAVLRTMVTTLEPIGAKATTRRLRMKVSGAATFSYDGNNVFYKSIDKPVPEKSKVCLADAEYYLSPAHVNASDDFWNSAVSAAKALAKL